MYGVRWVGTMQVGGRMYWVIKITIKESHQNLTVKTCTFMLPRAPLYCIVLL